MTETILVYALYHFQCPFIQLSFWTVFPSKKAANASISQYFPPVQEIQQSSVKYANPVKRRQMPIFPSISHLSRQSPMKYANPGYINHNEPPQHSFLMYFVLNHAYCTTISTNFSYLHSRNNFILVFPSISRFRQNQQGGIYR